MAGTADIKKLKMLLGLDGSSEKDVFVEFALETARENVMNYCHIEKIPEGLGATVIRMAADIYRNGQYGSEDMPVGDTSTSFGNASAEYMQDLFKKYGAVLRGYRKVVFK